MTQIQILIVFCIENICKDIKHQPFTPFEHFKGVIFESATPYSNRMIFF